MLMEERSRQHSAPAGFMGVGGWVEEEDCGVALLKGKLHCYESLEKQEKKKPKTEPIRKEFFPGLNASGTTSLPIDITSNKQT